MYVNCTSHLFVSASTSSLGVLFSIRNESLMDEWERGMIDVYGKGRGERSGYDFLEMVDGVEMEGVKMRI